MFTSFVKLAPEPRLTIWGYAALEPRILELECWVVDDGIGWHSPNPSSAISVILHACHESREEARRIYHQLSFGLWVNFSADTLLFRLQAEMEFDAEEELLKLIETDPLFQRLRILALWTDSWHELGFVGGQCRLRQAVAGWRRKPEALGLPLHYECVIGMPKVMDALYEVEKAHPGLGFSMREIFFPGGMLNDDEKREWALYEQRAKEIKAGKAVEKAVSQTQAQSASDIQTQQTSTQSEPNGQGLAQNPDLPANLIEEDIIVNDGVWFYTISICM